MKPSLSIATLFVLLLLAACAVTKQPEHILTTTHPSPQIVESLVGSYEFSSGKESGDVFISVTVSRNADDYGLSFDAIHPDAHGAAPEGSGTGRMGSDGVFRFTYEDAFSNRGSGTFQRGPCGYQLSIRISDVGDSRCMIFYGDFTLGRVKPKTRDAS